MTLHMREPCSIETIRAVSSRYTICDELRRAYENIECKKLEKAKTNIRVAVTMAKAMSRKLKEYNRNTCNDMFPKKEKSDGGR
jgi:hypothetical protein